MYKVDIDIFNTRKVIIALIYDKEDQDYAAAKITIFDDKIIYEVNSEWRYVFAHSHEQEPVYSFFCKTETRVPFLDWIENILIGDFDHIYDCSINLDRLDAKFNEIQEDIGGFEDKTLERIDKAKDFIRNNNTYFKARDRIDELLEEIGLSFYEEYEFGYCTLREGYFSDDIAEYALVALNEDYTNACKQIQYVCNKLVAENIKEER
jgi:hypothetical protein|nr:MAG TPA: hypothetical protein [Caudoviricetes sp.]